MTTDNSVDNSSSEPSANRDSGMLNDASLTLDPESFPLERYEPISELGKGSAGIVYLCRDRLLEKPVAIKCLRSLTAEQLIGFQAEAKATSLMNHIGVVAVLDFGVTSGGAPYMVMEYADGQTLEQRLKEKGPLPTSLAIKVFLQISEALEYAHSKGIFHRDLKSSNILILDESSAIPDVRLIDFGVARLKHAIQASTIVQGTTIVGTPAYMPPDQAAGMTYDERSEIYALGCAMFEALTGRTPFVGETALETIAMHAHEKIPKLSEIRGDIFFSDDLELIVRTCLAKEKEDRFETMSDLVNALSILDSGRSISENSTSGRFIPSEVSSGVRATGATKDSSSNRGRKPKAIVLLSVLAVFVILPALLVYYFMQPSLVTTVTDHKDQNYSVYSGLPSSKSGLRLNPKSIELTDRAWKLLESNATKDAQSLCSEALLIDKNNLQALDIRGVAKLMEGKLNGAREDLTKSIVRRGTSGREEAGTYFHRGLVFRANGDSANARIDFREARILGGYKPEPWEVKRFALTVDNLLFYDQTESDSYGRGLQHKGGRYKLVNGNDDELTALFEHQNPPVEDLYLKGGIYSGAYLAKIADLPVMKAVEFSGVQIYDRDFKFLGQCKSLEKLEIAHCNRVTGYCLRYTSGLNNLHFVQFKGGKLEDSNFSYLKTLNSLRVISLQGCQSFSGAGFSYLPDTIERIDWLSSGERNEKPCPINYNQKTFDLIGRLPKLNGLALASDSMDDTAYSALPRLVKLRTIVLVGTKPLSPKLIDTIKRMPNVVRFECRFIPIDSEVIERIGKCRNLDTLYLSCANLDQKSVTALAGLPLKLKTLVLDEPNLKKDIVLELGKIKTLTHLMLREVPVEIGVPIFNKVKNELPKCRIDVVYEDGRSIKIKGVNAETVPAELRDFYK